MALIPICDINNYEEYLGNWSAVAYNNLGEFGNNNIKIGTWTNTLGTTFIIDAIIIQCASGVGTATYDVVGDLTSTIYGSGATFPLQLTIGTNARLATRTDVQYISVRSYTNTAEIPEQGGSAYNPRDFQSFTFTLETPLRVTNGASVTIWPVQPLSLPSGWKTFDGSNIVCCIGASQYGCHASGNVYAWPVLQGESFIPKAYIKTSSGWKVGIPYIKTSNGWKQGVPYIKTSSGWKTL